MTELAGNEELREQIAEIVIKYVPTTSVMSPKQPTNRELAIDEIEALITASHTKPKALVKEEPYYLRNYLFDRGYLWHESRVITTEQMLELENHVNAIVTASNQQLLRELEGQKKTISTLVDVRDDYYTYEEVVPLSVIQDKLKKYGEEIE